MAKTSTTPTLTAFTRVAARVPLDDKNDWSSPGAAASARMDFSAPDLAPDLELNQIIWESVRGRGTVMPPPRRTGFVRPIAADDGDPVTMPKGQLPIPILRFAIRQA